MPQWMVRLAGNTIDLKTLSVIYEKPVCRVAMDTDGDYYLTRDSFNTMTEAVEVDGAARECLTIINADMKLRNPDYEPISVGSVCRENSDGSRSHFVFLSETISGHGRIGVIELVTGPDGQPALSPEPARAQARLSLFERDERVREALDYSQRCNPGDADSLSYAYKIAEIVLEDLGGGDAKKGAKVVASKGWSTEDEMRNFRESAHNREISGRKARHAGTQRVRPGITPMSEEAVIEVIRRVLREWLDWKAKQAS